MFPVITFFYTWFVFFFIFVTFFYLFVVCFLFLSVHLTQFYFRYLILNLRFRVNHFHYRFLWLVCILLHVSTFAPYSVFSYIILEFPRKSFHYHFFLWLVCILLHVSCSITFINPPSLVINFLPRIVHLATRRDS